MNKVVSHIVLTGLTAGTLDIAAALLNFFLATEKNPIRVLQYIASGVFGNEAFGGNPLMPVYGLLFHYCIATIWTMLFFLTYPKLKLMQKNWFASGVAYAVVVWGVMTQIVLPLSNVPPSPSNPDKALLAVAILIVCIGVPISFSAGRFYSRQHMHRSVL